MKILFLSVGEFANIEAGSVHIDLVRQLAEEGHDVYVACKNERRNGVPTSLKDEYGLHVLRVRTGNLKRTSQIEKGLSTILLEYQFLHAIKKYWKGICFDLVLYHTPPITFTKVIKYIKRRDHAKSYLLLKDIFPQNAVDMGMFKGNSLIYKYFRKKEKAMYAVSDGIGCMSLANCRYLKENNPEIPEGRIGIIPNSISIREVNITPHERNDILHKYGLPSDKKIFVYGGNLGRPQNVPFIIECLKKCRDIDGAFFLIVGSGCDFQIAMDYYQDAKPENVMVMKGLPKRDYEMLVNACDVGLVFLDYNFKIPNYPSRILSYMQSSMPVLCVTDKVTDVGTDMVKEDSGWCCLSNDPNAFRSKVLEVLEDDIKIKGLNSLRYLKEKYDVKKVAKDLIKCINDIDK